MPDQKDVVIAILGSSTALGAMLLVFQGLLLSILGNAPLPEQRDLDAESSNDIADSQLIGKKRQNVERMLKGYYSVLSLAIWADFVVLCFVLVTIFLSFSWMVSPNGLVYQVSLRLFFFDLGLIACEAFIGTWVITNKRVTAYDPE